MDDSLFCDLQKTVNTIYPLPITCWEAFKPLWQPYTAKRKELLTCATDVEGYLYFVREGVQRVYSLDKEGRESTLVLTHSHSFGGVLDSFLLQTPSRYYYETITSSSFLRCSWKDFNSLQKEHESIRQFLLTGLSGAFSGVLERLSEMQSCSAEERFLLLFQRSPHLLHIVPHKYIANYLGIDATNFSKLINRVIL